VVGLDVFTAVRSLSQDGYRVVLVRAPSRRYPPNYVVAQDPPEGASVRPGARITLTVANGRPKVLTVPNVLGLLADQAAATARGAGFVANVVVAAEPPPGTVGNEGKAWKQSPISGSGADEGSTMTVWVNP
jgi:beta-lactam-binding protein with PASTA domain